MNERTHSILFGIVMGFGLGVLVTGERIIQELTGVLIYCAGFVIMSLIRPKELTDENRKSTAI